MTSTESKLAKSCQRLAIAALLGTLISAYGSYVELTLEENENYEAMCDISEKISCSKVFSTEYGKGFGIVGKVLGEDSILNVPNGLFGLVFYPFFLVTAFIKCGKVARAQKWMALTSNFLSVYLAYLLYFVIQNLCVVCVALYIVNAFLLVFSWQKVAAIERIKQKTQ
ncbi:vitamin K epoxide reductase complex subunit 1-like protein 1 [Culicoides brevitarsis]|uniref:vitamin K epoxide reductase complex subunit 1-like protein 1 n=1 Tax=Culicoides brevitarsis TaxID=469753 RepID=UPI00307CC0DE